MDNKEVKPEADKIKNMDEEGNAELSNNDSTDEKPPTATVLSVDEFNPAFSSKVISAPDLAISENPEEFVTDGRFIEIKEEQSGESSYSRRESPDGVLRSEIGGSKSEAGSPKSEGSKSEAGSPKSEGSKSQVGSPKSEGSKSEVGSPKSEGSKSEVGSPKSEIENNSAFDIPNSEIKEPLTIHNSPLTNMEVHHHPDVEKKGLKEYILEGLMIFLAVTMGFFAESYREQLSEHSKEREYVINIKKDLVADTVNLNVWIPALYTRMLGFDTLINYLEMPAPVKDGGNMYYLARYATRSTVFEPSDNTILEMKSSGNLRLIRKREIVNDLMNFERVAAHYKNLDDIAEKEDISCYPLIGQLFDATIFNKMVIYKKNLGSTEKDYAAGQRNITVKPSGNPQLRSNNSDRVNLLIYYLHQRKSTFMGEVYDLYNQKNVAGSIIKKINKEYRLEDE